MSIAVIDIVESKIDGLEMEISLANMHVIFNLQLLKRMFCIYLFYFPFLDCKIHWLCPFFCVKTSAKFHPIFPTAKWPVFSPRFHLRTPHSNRLRIWTQCAARHHQTVFNCTMVCVSLTVRILSPSGELKNISSVA